MRAAVALLAQQGARQKAAASEAQAEASLALECDKPRTRSTGDSWTAKEADRVQAELQQWRAERDLDHAKRGLVGGRWAHVGGAGKRGAGNLRIVSIDKTRPRSAVDADWKLSRNATSVVWSTMGPRPCHGREHGGEWRRRLASSGWYAPPRGARLSALH